MYLIRDVFNTSVFLQCVNYVSYFVCRCRIHSFNDGSSSRHLSVVSDDEDVDDDNDNDLNITEDDVALNLDSPSTRSSESNDGAISCNKSRDHLMSAGNDKTTARHTRSEEEEEEEESRRTHGDLRTMDTTCSDDDTDISVDDDLNVD